MPEFQVQAEAREAKKAAELAPFIDAALARKRRLPELAAHEIPVVPASRPRAEINEAVR
jgi:hypothetical protein